MKKIIFYFLFLIKFHKLLLFSQFHKKYISTLMFHRINLEIDNLWPSMNPKSFEKLIILLKKNTKIISINDLEEINLELINKPIIILSFDDGYKDFIEYAMPILLKYNIPASINICPGLINKKLIPWTQLVNYYFKERNSEFLKLLNKFNIKYVNKINEIEFNNICNQIHNLNSDNYVKIISELNLINKIRKNELMNWNEIKICSKNNIKIGSHSMNHININKLNKDKAMEEIANSKKIIENNISNKINIFSFPNGFYNSESLSIAKNNYKYILMCDDISTKIKSKSKNYILSRINISKNDYKEEFFRSLGLHQFIKKMLGFKKKNSYL